jgi:hypothetical protein
MTSRFNIELGVLEKRKKMPSNDIHEGIDRSIENVTRPYENVT